MFSKSKTKRFQDEVSCAPPVGSYDISENKASKFASFQKSMRWKETKDTGPNGNCTGNNSNASSTHSFNKSILPKTHSSCKKITPTMSFLGNDLDSCRKSLEADIEFQESKVNSLLEKIKSLELQMDETKKHAVDIEESNTKLHDLLDKLRAEKFSLQTKNQQVEEQLLKVNAEFKILESSRRNESENTAALEKRLMETKQLHEQECQELEEKLRLSQDLNCDFREQLESIEQSMTENLRDLSVKYECLEQTLENVQTDYKGRLERSNSLLDKTKEAYESSKIDADTMNQVYSQLREDYNCLEVNSKRVEKQLAGKEVELLEKEKLEASLLQSLKLAEESKTNLQKDLMETINSLNEKIEEENKKYLEELAQLSNEKQDLSSKLEEKQELVEYCENLNESLQKQVDTLRAENAQLLESIERLNFEMLQSVNTRETMLKENERLNEILALEQKSNNEKEQEFNREKLEMRTDYRKIQDEIGRQLIETQIKLTKAEEKCASETDEARYKEMIEELTLWKHKYEELENKVSPFMTQLDEYELEKQSLLNENSFTQKEINKLSEKYAQILGHQNNKQKIHHVRKLKEENLKLKADVMKLKAATSKDRLRISQLENQINPKKIDTLKAFKHVDKENMRQPLKPTNS